MEPTWNLQNLWLPQPDSWYGIAHLNEKGISMFFRIGSVEEGFVVNLDHVWTIRAWIAVEKDDDDVTKEVKKVRFSLITENSPPAFEVDDETYDRVRKFIEAQP